MLEDLSNEELHRHVWRALVDIDADYALDTLPEPLVTYWTTQRVDFEVNNGGFLQLFHNSSRNIVEEAAVGFARLELDEHASLLRRATEVARQREVEEEIERIWAADDNLREFSRVASRGFFDDLDHAWYELPPAIDVGLSRLRNHATVVAAALPAD